MVKEFHDTFDCYSQVKPGFPDASVVKLRMELVLEEYQELLEAIMENDLIGVADAIADLHYVLSGTSLAFGIPEDKVLAEVHRSNMSKANEDGTVCRRDDGKVLKSARYSPPNLEKIIESA